MLYAAYRHSFRSGRPWTFFTYLRFYIRKAIAQRYQTFDSEPE